MVGCAVVLGGRVGGGVAGRGVVVVVRLAVGVADVVEVLGPRERS